MNKRLEEQIAKRLQEFGIENPHLEARWILEKSQDEKIVWPLVERRSQGEPLAYVLEERGFYKDIFFVKPGVLIPRPETEILVEKSFEFLKQKSLEAPLIYDFGCGSGCIGLSIIKELPKAKLVGFDLNETAIEVSKENARRLGLGERAMFFQQDVSSLPLSVELQADLVVANPPYIANEDPLVAEDVRKYEPGLALFGGSTGMEKIETWSMAAFRLLKSGGGFGVEFGMGQEDKVQLHLASLGFFRISIYKDLAGIDRTAFAEKL